MGNYGLQDLDEIYRDTDKEWQFLSCGGGDKDGPVSVTDDGALN